MGDLHLFVDAVKAAIDENGEAALDACGEDDISFQVCEAPNLRSSERSLSSGRSLSLRPEAERLSDVAENDEAHKDLGRPASKLELSAAAAAAPLCLLVLSSLLTGFAALSIGLAYRGRRELRSLD